MWKYIRRTLKGLFAIVTMLTIGGVFAFGILWVYRSFIEPILNANTLGSAVLIVGVVWLIGFLIYVAYEMGSDWETGKYE